MRLTLFWKRSLSMTRRNFFGDMSQYEMNRVVIEKNPHLTMQEAYDQTSALEPFRDMLMEKLAVLFEG